MISLKEILETVGRHRVMDELSVQASAANKASVTNSALASWFAVLRDLCAEHNLECPEELFRFRGRIPAEEDTVAK